jgi:hypothetical protein
MNMKAVLGLMMTGIATAALSAAEPTAPQPVTPVTPPAATPAPVVATPGAPAAPATNGAAPHIQFATPVYDFGKARAGEPIKYSYIFTNTGDSVLEVTHVQPSCGCTTAGDWTRKVEPGQTGIVPVQLNSAAIPAGGVFKTITVTSSDPKQPTLQLQLKGTVWKPIEVNPAYASLNIPPDAPSASTVVHIVNNTDEAFELSAPESNNRGFTATVTTNQPNKDFQVTITTVPPLPTGPVNAEVSIKTSSTNAPVIKIPFWVNVQPAIMLMPPSVLLPASPLGQRTTPTIMIQNNSTNQLALSEAAVTTSGSGLYGLTNAVNLPSVEVVVKEAQPGKIFSVALNFPPGFEIPAGQQVFFTAKSTVPQMPLIKIPITQMARPVQPPMPAPVAIPAVSPTQPAILTPPVPPGQTPPLLPPAAHPSSQK